MSKPHSVDDGTVPGSGAYWERRHRKGRTSGPGSYRRLAEFKATTINRLIAGENIENVVEFGCGDGNQLAMMRYPRYCGVDVSQTAIEICRRRFAGDQTKMFALRDELAPGQVFDCSVSLDVIFHLVEDGVFARYMEDLFDFARSRVIVYSSDLSDEAFEQRYGLASAPHVRHRKFTDWIDARRPQWTLLQTIGNAYPFDVTDQDNTSFADVFVFGRIDRA